MGLNLCQVQKMDTLLLFRNRGRLQRAVMDRWFVGSLSVVKQGKWCLHSLIRPPRRRRCFTGSRASKKAASYFIHTLYSWNLFILIWWFDLICFVVLVCSLYIGIWCIEILHIEMDCEQIQFGSKSFIIWSVFGFLFGSLTKLKTKWDNDLHPDKILLGYVVIKKTWIKFDWYQFHSISLHIITLLYHTTNNGIETTNNTIHI